MNVKLVFRIFGSTILLLLQRPQKVHAYSIFISQLGMNAVLAIGLILNICLFCK